MKLCSILFLSALTLPLYANPTTSDDILKQVGIEQKLNATIPLQLSFNDESGAPQKLGTYFTGNQPVILTMVYYECPMLCNEILNGLVKTLKVLPLEMGKDFQIISVSIHPKEKSPLAAEKKKNYLAQFGRPVNASGWHFLTGEDKDSRALANSIGFNYTYDAQIKQYAHGAAIFVLTPTGKVSRYFFGVEYAPKDLRLSLVEASEGKIGSLVDKFMLYCYRYDPERGKYGIAIMRVMRIGAGVTLFVIIAALWYLFRGERKRNR